ncbi:C80 family cysteine peptidase [Sandarakinorhabdus sp.]|uniref:C80 family cysteine peptidase n=1 Tax=Sandarakinorhabdus sp. TaxID=1916663 RepID=UPI00286D6C36|nr:C80 family cysteine peptidase [Sandarakinorhabdus sp.]
MLVSCELNRATRDDFLSAAKAALEKEFGERVQPLHSIKVPERPGAFMSWFGGRQERQVLVIVGHGTLDTQSLGGYTAVEVAGHLARQNVGNDQISMIKLYSCCVGDMKPALAQNNFAQQFVIELNKPNSLLSGVPVWAPMGLIVIVPTKGPEGQLRSWDWTVRRSNGNEVTLVQGMIEYKFNAENPGTVQGYIPPTL